jgi:hypothetical protein
MAIISSYPTITPTSSDLVLVVDTSEDGNPTKTATIGSVNALGGDYTTYVARWSQAGVSAPVSTVLQNTTGLTWVWDYSSLGVYDLIPGVDFGTKVYAVVSAWEDTTDAIPASTGTRSISIKTAGPTYIRVTCQDAADGSQIDVVDGGMIEIRIYS